MNITKIEMFDTPDAISMSSICTNCENLREVTFGNTKNISDMYEAFKFCFSLVKINMLDMYSANKMINIFKSCNSFSFSTLML